MSIIELKITLEYIEPAVKRTLQVPDNIRLDRLHLTVQAAMGWTNSHLYMFEAGGATLTPHRVPTVPDCRQRKRVTRRRSPFFHVLKHRRGHAIMSNC